MRRNAQRMLPRGGEMWMQDGQALYVIRSDKRGVTLQLSGTRIADQWQESWDAWAQQVRNRSVLRTDVRWKLE